MIATQLDKASQPKTIHYFMDGSIFMKRKGGIVRFHNSLASELMASVTGHWTSYEPHRQTPEQARSSTSSSRAAYGGIPQATRH
jgi:hypothetical protein